MAFDFTSMGGRGGGAPAALGPSGGGGYGGIGGPLPFSGGGGDYASAYGAALNFNKANYEQILNGFKQTAAAQNAQQGIIQGGYNNLTQDVLGGIQGIDASQRQAINNQYAQAQGAASQQLINRGLGNSTVQQSVDRGLMANRDQANLTLTNATQGLNAQYKSQLGSQALGYANQANMQNSQLAQNQLQWMNSINAGYPDAGAYAMLAQQKGFANKLGGVPPSFGGGSGAGGQGPGAPNMRPISGATAPGYYGSGGYGGGNNSNPSGYAYGYAAPQDLYPSAPQSGGYFGMSNDFYTGGNDWGAAASGASQAAGYGLTPQAVQEDWISQQDAQMAGQASGGVDPGEFWYGGE